MRKDQSFDGNIYIAGEDDQDVETNANPSDTSSSPPESPRLHRGSAHGSWAHTPPWPQSYRQSMDIYSNLTSPSLSMLSPSITRLGSSYLSTTLKKRTKSSDGLSPLTASFLPSKEERTESPIYEQVSSVPQKYASKKVADTHEQPPGCSATQAALNGINVLCGVGLLSTPFAVKEGGWLGLGLLFVFAIVSCYTGLLLRQCLDSQEGLETYPDIGQAAFGITGRLIISTILYIELYACCVEFLILEGDNLSALFPNASLSFKGVSLTSTEMFTIMTGIFVLPTVWLRDMNLLSYVSAGGVIASILVVFCVLWIGVVDGVGFHNNGPLLNLANLPVSIGLYGFCYSGHAVFPNIYTSLKKRSRFPMVLITSFIICTTMYGGMAIMGFTMFGEDAESQITLNLPQQLVASKIAVWTTVVNPFTKYALTMTPVALSLEELLPSAEYNLKSCWYSLTIRTILVVSTVCIALLVPFFAYVMSLIGSLLSMLVCLILPAACFLKIVGNTASIWQILLCGLIIVIGMTCAITGTYSSLVSIIDSFSS